MDLLRQFRFLITFLLTLVMLSPACAVPGIIGDQPVANDAGPVVSVSSPTTGQEIELGRELQVLSVAQEAGGIARTELVVDGEVIWVDANADPQPGEPFIVGQPWTPDVPGSHVIEARSYNRDNASGQSEPVTVNVVVLSAQTARHGRTWDTGPGGNAGFCITGCTD